MKAQTNCNPWLTSPTLWELSQGLGKGPGRSGNSAKVSGKVPEALGTQSRSRERSRKLWELSQGLGKGHRSSGNSVNVWGKVPEARGTQPR